MFGAATPPVEVPRSKVIMRMAGTGRQRSDAENTIAAVRAVSLASIDYRGEYHGEAVSFSTSAKSRLTRHDLGRFPTNGLFDRVARAVCEAGCLPRKELYEAWELARRVRRRFRGGRVVDVAGGHGLLAHLMLLLDDSSPCAVIVDPSSPPSAETLHGELTATWPRLARRVRRECVSLETFTFEASDVVVSCHACGSLTDRVLDRAVAAAARVAVLPCCHDVDTCDVGRLTGWVDSALAIDLERAWRLEQRGYRIWTQTIPASITSKNRLLVAEPSAATHEAPAIDRRTETAARLAFAVCFSGQKISVDVGVNCG